MGFKADLSFVEKLTMGAMATRSAIDYLRSQGFQPVELERYSTSNKIWTTKVKRLRLADILCVRTGTRFEVRGKSDLQVKMSHSPTNLDRRWDSGLRDEDVIALVPCDGGANVRVRGTPVCFSVGDLRATEASAKLGPPKSASEGAERDLTWPSCVPKADGEVLEVSPERIRALMHSGRQQTFQMRGKVPYIKPGDRFDGGTSILAGIVPRLLNIADLRFRAWVPADGLESANATDRYVSAKALGWRPHIGVEKTRDLLRKALGLETEQRTALEIASALARLDDACGFDFIATVLERPNDAVPPYLPMEAVLILAELRHPQAAELLDNLARRSELTGNEIRQAAVWGLGKAGVGSYERLVGYLDDEEDDVRLHAIVGLAGTPSKQVVNHLADLLVESQSTRTKAAASEALRLLGSVDVAEALTRCIASGTTPWVLATLGRLPRKALAAVILPIEIQRLIEPVMLLSENENWLLKRSVATDFQFLLLQTL